MDRQDLIKMAASFVDGSLENLISEQAACCDAVTGMKLFEAPVFAFAAADDDTFRLLKEPAAVGEHLLLPQEWLPRAKTVISFFLPFSDTVKKGNTRDMLWPSEEWLYGRVEGQAFLLNLCRYLNAQLIEAGYDSLVPALDERFWASGNTGGKASPYPDDKGREKPSFTSNWSERHAAFVCGLGTFGLSKGFITEKGMAGRLGSIITELPLLPDQRRYQGIYEYCSMCGACGRNCPVQAISVEQGKNHILCAGFLAKTSEKYKPRFGCGKCQVGVPCESGNPVKANPKEAAY